MSDLISMTLAEARDAVVRAPMEGVIQTRTVDMHVQRLRAKLGAAGDQIETVRGFGYRFRAAERPHQR